MCDPNAEERAEGHWLQFCDTGNQCPFEMVRGVSQNSAAQRTTVHLAHVHGASSDVSSRLDAQLARAHSDNAEKLILTGKSQEAIRKLLDDLWNAWTDEKKA